MYFLPPQEVSKRNCFFTLKFYLSLHLYTPAAVRVTSPFISTPSLCKPDQNKEVYGEVGLV